MRRVKIGPGEDLKSAIRQPKRLNWPHCADQACHRAGLTAEHTA